MNGLYLNMGWNRNMEILLLEPFRKGRLSSLRKTVEQRKLSLLEPFAKGLLSLVPGAPAEHTGTTG